MSLFWFSLLISLFSGGVQPSAQSPQEQPPLTTEEPVRFARPIRLGGVYTLGLGENSHPLEESARLKVPLSAENAKWIADNCDVIALNAVNITPTTFPEMNHRQRLLTPLLYVYASTLYEQEQERGNVGGWRPEMRAWTLQNRQRKEVPHPDPGGHWMDFGNTDWATHWRERVLGLVGRYQAQGVVAAELPPGNTFVGNNLALYPNFTSRMDATARWLQAARAENRFLLLPTAQGFDALVGHPTQPPPPEAQRLSLAGRGWDHFYPFMDGAWAEGWIRPYWLDGPLPVKFWEQHIDAADRAARLGKVFIATAAYSNDDELEYILASYLLIYRREARVVLQPMPILPGPVRVRRDIGFSLAVLRNEIRAKARYFDVALGLALQERHFVPAQEGFAWRRNFLAGIVYVNPDDTRTVKIALGGSMRRLTGERVTQVILPPHSGAILLKERQ